jgi:hypothetical protein
MPVDFLTMEQEQSYSRYTGEPSVVELERFFYLDDADHTFILAHRGERNKLGVALQLTTARYRGTFLDNPTDVPSGVVAVAARPAVPPSRSRRDTQRGLTERIASSGS